MVLFALVAGGCAPLRGLSSQGFVPRAGSGTSLEVAISAEPEPGPDELVAWTKPLHRRPQWGRVKGNAWLARSCWQRDCPVLYRTMPLDPVRREVDYGSEVSVFGHGARGARGLLFATAEQRAAGSSSSGVGRLYAFRTDCSTPCAWLWKSPLVDGWIAAPTVVGDRVFVTDGEGLHVFPTWCRSDGGTCQELWHGLTPSFSLMTTSAPRVRGEHVLFTANHYVGGGDSGSPSALYVFPTDCPAPSCRPLWRVESRSTFIWGPAFGAGYIFVGWARDDQVTQHARGFPLRCERRCAPTFRGTGDRFFVVDVRDRKVYVAREGGMGVFRADCARLPVGCREISSFSLTRQPDRPLIAGHAMYVHNWKTVFAFPRSCSRECAPSWTWTSERRVYGLEGVRGGLLLVREGGPMQADQVVALDPSVASA